MDIPSPPLDPATDALAERGMANFVLASGIWARASGGTTWSYPGIHCFTSTVPRRAFNQVIVTSESATTRDLQDAVARFARLGLRYRVRLRDRLDNDVRPRLEGFGLVHRGGIPAMVFDGELPAAAPTTLQIEQVRDASRLDDMVAMVANAFEWEPEQLGQVFRPALLEERAWSGWVGYEGGVPVAASQMTAHEGTGGLYYIAVLDSHRRKGYGDAITRVAIEAARAQGCDLITLNASQDGYPVYQRLGFRDAGKHVGYTPPDEDEPTY